MIDIKFSSLSDTPKDKNGNYKDPDRHSKTLREYHMYLWSKHLQSGYFFSLDKYSQGRMIHKFGSQEFVLSSDSIGHTYRKWPEMKDIIKHILPNEIDSFLKKRLLEGVIVATDAQICFDLKDSSFKDFIKISFNKKYHRFITSSVFFKSSFGRLKDILKSIK